MVHASSMIQASNSTTYHSFLWRKLNFLQDSFLKIQISPGIGNPSNL